MSKLLPLGLAFFLIGCQSSEALKEKSQFKHRISDKGLKHFEVNLPRPAAKDFAQQRTDPNERNTRTNTGELRRNTKRLEKLTELYLEDTGYCREGFWVISVDAYSPIMRLRGECNEAANASDRARYPNTIKEW